MYYYKMGNIGIHFDSDKNLREREFLGRFSILEEDFEKLSSKLIYKVERNMIKNELIRVRNFALLAENSNNTIKILDDILHYYNLSLFKNEN